MFLKKVSHLAFKRSLHVSGRLLKDDFENPIYRTFRILGQDISRTFEHVTGKKTSNSKAIFPYGVPSHTDILIVGGGAMGSSIAYWLKEKTNADGFEVLVVDKDLTYSQSSTCLSVGGLRQQFSLPENIQMSLFGAEFLRTLKKRFGADADVSFTPHGYLVLASEEGAEQLISNSKLQKELGAVNMILHKHQIKDRFPWMNVDDVAVGCLGLEKEGWFDPWSLLMLLKRGAMQQKTRYLSGDVVGFEFEERDDLTVEGVNETLFKHPRKAVIKMPDGATKSINFALCIIAAGAHSGKLAELLDIGTGNGILKVPLPVEPRKRYVYSFSCQGNPPGLNTPMTIDYSGAYFRRDGLGGNFLGGISPELQDEPDVSNLDVNFEYFDKNLWPVLAHRVPAFNAVKVHSGWSGFYEYNKYDENGIVGCHPYYTNIYFATGFSGHGIQQAPAVGRAVAELVLDGKFETIDLTRLAFDRLLLDQPVYEAQII